MNCLPAATLREPSPMEVNILSLLRDRGTLSGKDLHDISWGEIKLGTVYVTLQRLERKGLAVSRQEPRPEGAVGPQRRVYEMTDRGRAALRLADAMSVVRAAQAGPLA